MKVRKSHVAVMFGGPSVEHAISLQSAAAVMRALDPEKYQIAPIYIDNAGRWLLCRDIDRLLQQLTPSLPTMISSDASLCIDVKFARKIDAHGSHCIALHGSNGDAMADAPIDVVFPMVHGTLGEDGAIQGLARSFGLPCVGTSVLGAAVTADKDCCNRLLREHGLPVTEYRVVTAQDLPQSFLQEVDQVIGYPCFVKPACGGSSVGIHKVDTVEGLQAALRDALRYDHRALIERCIVGREIECAVLGNDKPQASMPGELTTDHGFYTYAAKYTETEKLVLTIPAVLTLEQTKKVRQLAIDAYQATYGQGMARVDFFLDEHGEFWINEINTVPGFTDEFSMYPKMWQASGVSYRQLLDTLIELAFEQAQRERELTRDYG